MKKTIIILSIIFILILPAAFTHFYANLWYVLTENGYFIPKESNILCFNATKMNSGSGGWWLYGEDNQFYYALNVEQNNNTEYFTLQKGQETEYFDKFDYHSWQIEKRISE